MVFFLTACQLYKSSNSACSFSSSFFSSTIVDSSSSLPELAFGNYWRSHLVEKANDIRNKSVEIGRDGASFVFMTDYHQNTSAKKSPEIIKYLSKEARIDYTFFGGDITDGVENTSVALDKMKEFSDLWNPVTFLPIRGNHDCEPTANKTIDQVSNQEYYKLFIKPIQNVINNDESIYFSLDDNERKTRFISLDSGSYITEALDKRQIEWFQQKLMELDSSWTIVIFQHMVLQTNNDEKTVSLSSYGRITMEAIDEIFKNIRCNIAAIICGHIHVDAVLETKYNFKIISTTCDSGGANAAYDWNISERTIGTINECAFDVFLLNTKQRTIDSIRVGAGTSRFFAY